MRFKSKHEAMNRRNRRWCCDACHAWYRDEKPRQCRCGAKEFLYFASVIEAKRYAELYLLSQHGKITNLVNQPRYPISINGVKITTYVADFAFTDEKGNRIIEDVKPKNFMTDMAKMKIKMAEATYGIQIQIVER